MFSKTSLSNHHEKIRRCAKWVFFLIFPYNDAKTGHLKLQYPKNQNTNPNLNSKNPLSKNKVLEWKAPNSKNSSRIQSSKSTTQIPNATSNIQIHNPNCKIQNSKFKSKTNSPNWIQIQNPKLKLQNPQPKFQNSNSPVPTWQKSKIQKAQNPKSQIEDPNYKIQNSKSTTRNPRSKLKNKILNTKL